MKERRSEAWKMQEGETGSFPVSPALFYILFFGCPTSAALYSFPVNTPKKLIFHNKIVYCKRILKR